MRTDRARVLPAFLFALAVLSKESAVALPIAAAGWLVFCRDAGTRTTVRRLVPWLLALADLCGDAVDWRRHLRHRRRESPAQAADVLSCSSLA